MLQRRYWVYLIIISLSLVLGAIAIGIAQAAWNAKPVVAAEEDKQLKTITVTGNGEVVVEPDVAYIQFGIMSKGSTAEAAQQANADAYAQVEKVLFNTYKLNKNDVKTTGFHVWPEYSYAEKEAPKVTGYTATHSIQVTYRKLDEIGTLLDELTKAGVNQMNNIQFGSEKISAYEIDALKKAMTDARAKADALAASERRSIKGVIQINEAGPSYSIYQGPNVGIARDVAYGAEASTSINPGEITIRKQVTVQYEF